MVGVLVSIVEDTTIMFLLVVVGIMELLVATVILVVGFYKFHDNVNGEYEESKK